MCGVRVKFILLITIFLFSATQCKGITRSQKEATISTSNHLPKEETQASAKSKGSRNIASAAILAIEIVDPNENSTSPKSKNSKRTTSSQLGYGFQPNNYFGVSNKPKLVFYKYSQEGFPSYEGNNYYNNRNQFNIQKSIEYDLANPQARYTQQSLSQYYQPGTTLYTTYNQGQVNQLSSQVPQQTSNTNVPVIYLKIYSNQLSDPAFYPNLPENHPYSNLNNVNLQSLLAGYLQNTQQSYNDQLEQVKPGVGQTQGYQQVYVSGNTDQNQNYYLTQPVEYPQNYQNQINQYQYQQFQQPQQIEEEAYLQEDNLPTHENYPDDAHTRVIFHSDNGGHLPEKSQSLRTSVVPTVTSYVSPKLRIPSPQSYSSLEFRASQPDYTLNQHLQQPQDEQGYYYLKPSTVDYTQKVVQPYQYTPQTAGNLPLIDAQNGERPFNYHAHPTNAVKRNVRRTTPAPKKITKIKQED